MRRSDLGSSESAWIGKVVFGANIPRESPGVYLVAPLDSAEFPGTAGDPLDPTSARAETIPCLDLSDSPPGRGDIVAVGSIGRGKWAILKGGAAPEQEGPRGCMGCPYPDTVTYRSVLTQQIINTYPNVPEGQRVRYEFPAQSISATLSLVPGPFIGTGRFAGGDYGGHQEPKWWGEYYYVGETNPFTAWRVYQFPYEQFSESSTGTVKVVFAPDVIRLDGYRTPLPPPRPPSPSCVSVWGIYCTNGLGPHTWSANNHLRGFLGGREGFGGTGYDFYGASFGCVGGGLLLTGGGSYQFYSARGEIGVAIFDSVA